jgi:uncharacterized RDD family membrane protein YckC
MDAMDESAPTPHPSALCAEHPQSPATLICARCGSYACDLCRRVGYDHRDYCFRCAPALQQLATPWTRLAAVLVDRCTTALPLFVALLLGGVVSVQRGEEKAAPLVALLMMVGMVGSMGMLCYQLYLLLTVGQSLGKRMMGIQVVRTDGSPIDIGRLILLRNLVPGFINLSTCGLFGLVDALIIFTAERRCLHDHIADTKVTVVNEHTR